MGLTDNGFPVPARVLPHTPEYHLMTTPVPPPPPFKVRIVLPPLHIVVKLAVAEVGSADFEMTLTTVAEVVELLHTPLVTIALKLVEAINAGVV